MTNTAREFRPSLSVRAGSRAGMIPVRATVSLHPGSGRVQGMRGGATSSRPCRIATLGRGDRSPNLPVGLPSAGATFRPSGGFSPLSGPCCDFDPRPSHADGGCSPEGRRTRSMAPSAARSKNGGRGFRFLQRHIHAERTGAFQFVQKQADAKKGGGDTAALTASQAKEPVAILPYWARRLRAGGSSRRGVTRITSATSERMDVTGRRDGCFWAGSRPSHDPNWRDVTRRDADQSLTAGRDRQPLSGGVLSIACRPAEKRMRAADKGLLGAARADQGMSVPAHHLSAASESCDGQWRRFGAAKASCIIAPTEQVAKAVLLNGMHRPVALSHPLRGLLRRAACTVFLPDLAGGAAARPGPFPAGV